MATILSGTTGIDMENTSVSNLDVGALEHNAVNKQYADLKQSKSELAYNVNTSSYIPNTLESGAIIERGSNANGEYTKFADGTLICKQTAIIDLSILSTTDVSTQWGAKVFPHQFISQPACYLSYPLQSYMPTAVKILCYGSIASESNASYIYLPESETFNNNGGSCVYYAICIGRWK